MIRTRNALNGVSLRHVQSVDDLTECKRWAAERRETPLGVDTESSGLNPHKDKCRMIQVGDMRTGWAAPAHSWGGGLKEIIRDYDRGLVMHNCLTGSTEVITKSGIRTLRDLWETGDKTRLLSGNGTWVESAVHRYGRARMLRIVLKPKGRRSCVSHEVVCTENHRWELGGSSLRDLPKAGMHYAADIVPGDKITSVYAPVIPDTASSAFIHGLIFADGSHSSYSPQCFIRHGVYAYQIRLCGWKEKFADLFSRVSYPASSHPDPWCRCKSEIDYKVLPPDDADPNYIASFIEGWHLLDGSASPFRHSRILCTSDPEYAEWLKANAARGGWACTGFSKSTSSGGFRPGAVFYDVTITKDPDLLWTVKSVENAGISEYVYCPDVPGDHRFALASGIKTGNSPYDTRVLSIQEDMAPRWEVTDDSLLMNHLKDSLKPAGLKPRAALDIDPRALAGERILHDAMIAQNWTWGTVPLDFEPYVYYAALDPVLACHTWARQSPEVFTSFRHPYDLERAAARICAGMMTAGMLLDIPYISKTIDQMSAWRGQAMDWLKRHHGITSVGSNEQVGHALNRAGIPTMMWTDGGKPSIGKDTLRLYATMYPQHAALIKTIVTARKTGDIIGRHLEKFLAMADSNGVIHAQIWTCKARTSRMSITDPPLQTLDRDEPVIRGSFIPRPGHVFISIDADQIEARLAAHFSRDQAMIEMFRIADAGGPDFFRLMAGQIFGVSPESISKKDIRRQVTKNATYGVVYGSGVETMALTAGVPVHQMLPVHTAFKHLYPGIGNLMAQIIRSARDAERGGGRGCVYTPTGRRLYTDPGKSYAGLNYKIQGHAAEIMKRGLIDLDNAGFGPSMRLTVHDEVILEVPREHAEEALRTAVRILNDKSSYLVPVSWAGSIMTDRWKKN